ncbi:MAG: hypothetical protein KDB07_11305 [Planctomycetes bacterium]|nr:hypothetical protein [Planctomycetota bacterium]
MVLACVALAASLSLVAAQGKSETDYQRAALDAYVVLESASAQEGIRADALRRFGVALARMGQYREAERFLRRATRLDPLGMREASIEPLTKSEAEHLRAAIEQLDPSAIFVTGVLAKLTGDTKTAQLSMLTYELVRGGDSDARAIWSPAPVDRALLRADARASQGQWAAARAELGLAEGMGESPLATLGRKAAYHIGSGAMAKADLAIASILKQVPPDSTLYVHLPAPESAWWRRAEVLEAEGHDFANAPISEVIVLALSGDIVGAHAKIDGLTNIDPFPQHLQGVPLERLKDLRSFVASCAKLPRLTKEDAQIESALERYAAQLTRGNFDDAANIAAEELGRGNGRLFTSPFVVAVLLDSQAENDTKRLPQLVALLQPWAKQSEKHTPAIVQALLTPQQKGALLLWLAAKDIAGSDPSLMFLRLALGASELDLERLRSHYETGYLPEHWVPAPLLEAVKAARESEPEPSLPDPKLADGFFNAGDKYFRAKDYDAAWRAYLEASRHDPTHRSLPRSMIRVTIALEKFDDATNSALSLLKEAGPTTRDDALKFSFGLFRFADGPDIKDWRTKAAAYASARPADSKRVLLEALLAWEAQDWPEAQRLLDLYLKTYVDLGGPPKAVDSLLDAARFRVSNR